MEVQVGIVGQLFQERRHVFRMGADTVHARIDRHHDFYGLSGAFGDVFEGIQVHGVIHRQGEVVFYAHEHVFRQRKAQDVHGAGKSGSPEFGALFYSCHGGSGVSFFHGNAECFHDAMAIGIGFHHGQYVHLFRQVLADHSQIVTKCIQIDFHVRNWHNKFSLQ